MKKSRPASSKNEIQQQTDMLDSFSPWPIGKILRTSAKPKIDVFQSYKPTRSQCLDYNISQTEVKMLRGDIKVNVKKITATYEPLPPELCKPKRKKVKHFSGGPPQWKFIDEVHREQQVILQEKIRKELKAAIQELHAKKGQKLKDDHKIVQDMVGPEWFIEMSVNQLRAVELLKYTIDRDLMDGTTVNTKEVLAVLGLVLRPNGKQVEKALMHSCRSPVEFLLVLYQIINPHRKNYSLNDRLILSAVAHLSITETLRELHVRIPSPPKIAKVVKKVPKKAKKKTYPSPYLEPLGYEPPPPEFTGIYRDKHRQYPESPYFSYLLSFYIEKFYLQFVHNLQTIDACEEDKEITREYNDATKFYGTLPGAKDTPVLMPPTTIPVCQNFLHPEDYDSGASDFRIRLCKLPDSDSEECCCKDKKPIKKKKRSCCEKYASKFLENMCFCEECWNRIYLKHCVRIYGGIKKIGCKCDRPIPIIQGTALNKTCKCFEDFRNRVVVCRAMHTLTANDIKYVIGGVTMTLNGPVYNISSTIPEKVCLCEERRKRKVWLNNVKEKLTKGTDKYVIGGISMTKDGPVYILSTAIKRKPCTCLEDYRNNLVIAETQYQLANNAIKFILGGLVKTKIGPVYYVSGVLANIAKDEEVPKVRKVQKPPCLRKCEAHYNYENYEDIKSSSESSSSVATAKKTCTCSEEYRNNLLIAKTQSELAKNKTKFILGSLVNTKVGPVYYISGILAKIPRRKRASSRQVIPSVCKCGARKNHNDTVSSSESSSYSVDDEETNYCTCVARRHGKASTSESNQESKTPTCCSSESTVKETHPLLSSMCKCKEELNVFMSRKCQCEECNIKLRQSYATYIVSGTKPSESGNALNVVGGIRQPQCSCLHNYLKKIQQVEHYRARAKTRYDMKKQDNKYCISGVQMTPEGPVYIVSGLRPPVDCECAKALREKREQEEALARMPEMPDTGRIKYEIAGIKAMPDRNIFIVSKALSTKPCKCMDILKQFEASHSKCVQEFDAFVEKVEEETALYMEDLNDAGRKTMLGGFWSSDNIQQEIDETFGAVVDQEEALCVEDVPDCMIPHESPLPFDEGSVEGKSSSDECSCSKSEMSSEDSSECSSEESSECGPCIIEKPPDVKPIKLPGPESMPDFFFSKRFAIFKKFPEDYDSQVSILKHILSGMAEDGFPLAKLPQCYKLPIFKLWLEMRSGKYWVLDNKFNSVHKSKSLWKHTDLCYREPKLVHMPFTLQQANAMTWKDAELIKRLAAEKSNDYYRKVKQVTVETGRELYATTFSYEFPNRYFRNCFFAYIPSKEEAVFPYKIVQPHDVRVPPKKFPCYC